MGIQSAVPTDVDATMYLVTPIHAARLLEKNNCNRPISDKQVKRYANTMRNGEWELTNDAITLNGDGSLQNGQHRLKACLESGRSFPCLVMTGVPKTAFQVMDQGKKRTLSDIFSIEGIKNHSAAAATTRFLVAHQHTGNPDTKVLADLGLSPKKFVNYYRQEPTLIQMGLCKAASLRHKWRGVTKSAAAGAFVICARVDYDAAVDFYASILDGVGLGKGDPWLAIRDKLTRIGADDRHEMGTVEQAALIIKAFKHFIECRTISPAYLKWRRFGKTAEKFPTI